MKMKNEWWQWEESWAEAQQEHCMRSSQVKSISRKISGAIHLQGGGMQVCGEMQRLEKQVGVRLTGLRYSIKRRQFFILCV